MLSNEFGIVRREFAERSNIFKFYNYDILASNEVILLFERSSCSNETKL
jgi:hypothetical protein